MDGWTYKVELSTTIPWTTPRGAPTTATLTATAGLHLLGGNSRPYFSVTGDIRRPGANDIDTGGCIHDEILAHWPVLAPVVAVHLADDTGTPLHAVENGRYWLGLEARSPRSAYDPAGDFETDEQGREWSPVRFANTWRCTLDEARTIRADVDQAMLAVTVDPLPPAVQATWEADLLGDIDIGGLLARRRREAALDQLNGWLDSEYLHRWACEADVAISVLSDLGGRP